MNDDSPSPAPRSFAEALQGQFQQAERRRREGADFILALDQGTTSSRAIVFDRAGRIAGRGQEEVTPLFPSPGHVEQDPNQLWVTTLNSARKAIEATGASARAIAAIGLTNQRETTILWDRATGVPVAPAVVWQSRITAPECARLKALGHEPLVRAKTGLVLDPYFSATKISWILDQSPALRQRAERGELCFGTVDSFLLWRLTSGRVHATDVTNASRTLLWNLREGTWDDELLRLFRVPRALLPEVKPSSGLFGMTDRKWFGEELPITGIAGDQQAATFGQQCFAPGLVKNTYGTGCFAVMNTGDSIVDSKFGLLGTAAWKVGDETTFALEGAIFVAGAVIQWLRDGLGIISQASESETLASRVKDNGGVYLVPAFVGLGAPYWDPDARGAIYGLTRGATREHLCRAALESIVLQTRDVVEAMSCDSGLAIPALRVDGGATANDLLMQLQADVLGIPVHRPQILETTALGAAYLAGLASGFWPDVASLANQWHLDRVFEPRMSVDQRDTWYAAWKKAVERTRS
jgi:glycerol kinase